MTTPDRTRRPVTAAVAALGLVVASALVALLVAGLFEGLAGAPGWLPETAAVLVFLGGLAVTGQVMVDVAGPHAIRSAIGVVVAVGLVGYMASRVTEAHGERFGTDHLTDLRRGPRGAPHFLYIGGASPIRSCNLAGLPVGLP